MKTIIILIYLVTVLITYPASFAFFQRKYPTLAEEFYRNDLAFSVLIALVPGGFITVFFMTGFYEYGFKFK